MASRLPDYRVVAALPLAYAIIVSGALLRNRRLAAATTTTHTATSDHRAGITSFHW
ncbi:hypothetical protein MAHJHV51_51400 [Mycobacterium avium subsp. hominissuis]